MWLGRHAWTRMGAGWARVRGLLSWSMACSNGWGLLMTPHSWSPLSMIVRLPDINTINPEKMMPWDVPVDVIITPTQVIRTHTQQRKPSGILWDKLSPQKLASIRVLQDLKRLIEARTGTKLPSGPDELLPPLAARGRGRPQSPRSPPRPQSAQQPTR